MYADRLETQPFARNMIGTFAELVRGTGNPRTADAGCGPGHLTALLRDLGLDAFGVDLSPGMVAHARRAHPALRFAVARMEELPVADGVLGGVLAHYSMIHTPPGDLPELLAEQFRVLAPRGLLLASFFATDSPETRCASTTRWPPPTAGRPTGSPRCWRGRARALRPAAPRPRTSERGFLDAHVLARRP